jgi:UDP-N-acetylmuramyl pentapeptide phosphotransferase/UDP-N-acetylglucosamine-1-phosphate transferase
MSWAAFASAFAVTFALTPAVAVRLRRRGRLDVPNTRSSHTRAIPRGGGIACAAGCAVGLAVARPAPSPLLYAALGSLVLLTATGYADDRRSLSSVLRLLTQVAAGVLLGAALGPVWLLAGPLLFVVLVNCVNFMDGINGITSVTMATWGVTAVYLAQTDDVPLLGDLGLVTAATALAFLPWNAPRAQVFLGDVGSYLFGALVATGAVVAVHGGAPLMATLSPLLVYLFDVGVTLARRLHRRAPLLQAHREHIYQQLVAELPLGHGHVAAYVLVLNGILVLLWLHTPAAAAVALTVVVLLGYALSVPAGRRILSPRRKEWHAS